MAVLEDPFAEEPVLRALDMGVVPVVAVAHSTEASDDPRMPIADLDSNRFHCSSRSFGFGRRIDSEGVVEAVAVAFRKSLRILTEHGLDPSSSRMTRSWSGISLGELRQRCC